MSIHSFDYAIIGAGAAGLHLAMQLAADKAFEGKTVLILDKDEKKSNDRTWSFWEKGITDWDKISTKSWNKAVFYSKSKQYLLPLSNHHYKTIRSADFYAHAKKIIAKHEYFTWLHDEVADVTDQTITGAKSKYHAGHIFDSRLPSSFTQKNGQHVSLIQHFLGWFIETEEPIFDEDEITIMDYRVRWKSQTSFHYILPFSSQKALIEFTLFNESLLAQEDYEKVLRGYIEEQLGIKNFKIIEEEKGQIPMSTYPFHLHHEKYLTKIGTAGGWVRPSSGYSFKNAQRYSAKILNNIKKGREPHLGVAVNRFRFYDKIFLAVLKERNDLGAEIFERLYTRQPIVSLFRFLDEGSTWLEDIKIMLSLNQPIFRKALRKVILRKQRV